MQAQRKSGGLAQALLWAAMLTACGGGGGGGDGDTSAPTAVTGLTVTLAAGGQANLAWNACADNTAVTGYRIYRGTGSATPILLRSVASPAATDTGLAASTTYCYQLSAYDAAGNESARSPARCATTPAPLLFGGFDFALASGDFWEYRWNFYDQSWAQGSNPRTATAEGRLWVVLGAPATIEGINAYAVQVHGNTQALGLYDFNDRDFAPRWKYLAVADARILGSVDGQTLRVIFDARTGKWAGGGYFGTLPDTVLTVATEGSIDAGNPFITGAAVRAGRSSSQSQCEYFPGVGSICGDSSYDYHEHDHFRANVGPVAYRLDRSFSSCGGGFCSGGTKTQNVGMVASSFTGQASPLRAELEPNDTPGTAHALAPGDVAIGSVTATAPANAGNTPLVVNSSYTALVEDWYSFSLTATRPVRISLGFAGSPTADVDLYLVDAFGTTVLATSNADNPSTRLLAETVTRTLGPGTYRIAVDGYATPGGAVNYTLQVE